MNGEPFAVPSHNKEVPTQFGDHTSTRALQLGSIGISAIQDAYKQLCNKAKDQSLGVAQAKQPLEVFLITCIAYVIERLPAVNPGQYKLKDVHDLLASVTESDHTAMQLFDTMLTENRAFINNKGYVLFTLREPALGRNTIDANAQIDTTDKTL